MPAPAAVAAAVAGVAGSAVSSSSSSGLGLMWSSAWVPAYQPCPGARGRQLLLTSAVCLGSTGMLDLAAY